MVGAAVLTILIMRFRRIVELSASLPMATVLPPPGSRLSPRETRGTQKVIQTSTVGFFDSL